MSRAIFTTLTYAATIVVLGGAGCTRENRSREPNSRTPYPVCSSNADCAAGTICTTLGCCPGCHSDADCGADQTCNISASGNFCAPKGMSATPTDPAPTGTSLNGPAARNTMPKPTCNADSNCPTGWTCNAGVCAAPCSDTVPCGSGQTCVSGRCYASGASTCGSAGLATCSVTADCGTGRVCVGARCHATCSSSTDCPTGQLCSSGACTNDPHPAVAQCVFDSDCGAAFRCVNASCHSLCASNDQCGANSFCDHGVCRADYRPTI